MNLKSRKKYTFDFKGKDLGDHWGYGQCEYAILELKFHIFGKIKIFVEKVLFDHFLAHESQKSRIFKDFGKIMIFHQKPWF